MKKEFPQPIKCDDCEKTYFPCGWCSRCEGNYYITRFDQWTTGNSELDELIRESQKFSNAPSDIIVYIPFENIVSISAITDKVTKIIWPEGPRHRWDTRNEVWVGTGPYDSVMKRLTNKNKLCADFIRQIWSHRKCMRNPSISDVVGLTVDDEDNILVVVRREKRNLHGFIESEKGVLSVETIVALGWDIIGALNNIHSHGLVHRNLHSGNILVDTDDDENYGGYHSAVISDLGFYGSPEKETDISYERRYVYGVLPFVAPEVLRGNEHTAKSDIYSFGMILWTMLSGEVPWRNEHFNAKLARSIVEGSRPDCPLFTPPFLYEIVQNCWELDPNNRPTSEELNKRFEIIESAIHDDFDEVEIYGQQVNADNERKRWAAHNSCAQKNYKIQALSSLSSTRIQIVEN
ncbi:unnamed protein product [Rhizophagus irregularis]|uniref:Uncharacterized protein n=1 Tax=Rhizophagus irregularis TaxID=588596 RepID=A0A2I1EVM7_9GLOM|nr:kinase-like protein [Rhizophagus irregularis]CAB5383394.1 unnamed protein product [Rhizophagus irregularis]